MITTGMIREMRRLRRTDLTYKAIAARVGCSAGSVARFAHDGRRACFKGERVLELTEQGFPDRAIAERLGITPLSVRVLRCQRRRRLMDSSIASTV